ncbi:MAG: leucine-rich repeat domain-containing protein [Roseburia sp.]|nr:leucine-rich repeat domain-containing protein [Roseburia sp.]MCM1279372.1 leucine-rich repeat domain-containing protein [Robinsoniella sp.]
MKKKLFTLLPLLFILIWITPKTAHAQDNLFTYELKEDNTAKITGSTATGNVTIPAEIEGHTVTEIGGRIFYAKSGIYTISIPATVTTIGEWDYAFSYCYSLTAITVDAANPAFCSQDGVLYTKDKSVLYNFPCGKSTASYHVPETVDHICCTAFASARYLNKLYLDGKDTYWAGYTFYNTGQMTVYYIPGGRSELYAKNHAENGRSNESDSLYPKYCPVSEGENEEGGKEETGKDDGATGNGGNTTGNGGSTGAGSGTGNVQPPANEKIKVGKTNLKTLKNQVGRKVKISYKKVTGAKGYEILYSTSKKFTKKTTHKVNTKKTTCTIKKLKKGKTYYFKVRAYKLDKQNQKVYGSYSKAKNLRIKK